MANIERTALTNKQLTAIRADLALALIDIFEKRNIVLQVGEIKQTAQLRGRLHRVDFDIVA